MLKPIIKHYDVHLLAFFVVTDMSCWTLTERERERERAIRTGTFVTKKGHFCIKNREL